MVHAINTAYDAFVIFVNLILHRLVEPTSARSRHKLNVAIDAARIHEKRMGEMLMTKNFSRVISKSDFRLGYFVFNVLVSCLLNI